MGFVENEYKIKNKNLIDSVRSNYLYGEKLIRLNEAYRYGLVSIEEYRIKKIYYKLVIQEQTKWECPLTKRERRKIYDKAKRMSQ